MKKVFSLVSNQFNFGFLFIIVGFILIVMDSWNTQISIKALLFSWQMLLIISGLVILIINFFREQKYIYEWDIPRDKQDTIFKEQTYSDYYDIFI